MLCWLNKHAEKFFVVGLASLSLLHWRWRQQDQLVIAERVRKQQEQQQELPSADTPLVSVLVAAWNEEDIIRQHIESFLSLRYQPKQLILCAGGNDHTHEIAIEYQSNQVIVLEQQAGMGKQRALRAGFAHAAGEIVYLTDADCLYNDIAFEAIIKPIICNDAVVTTGRARPLDSQMQNPFVVFQWVSMSYNDLYVGDTLPGLLGRNSAIRKEILSDVQAFEVEAPSGTDYTLARQLLKAGHTIRYAQPSVVKTEFPATVSSYYNKNTRWLRNLIVIGLQTGDYPSLIHGLRTGLVGIVMVITPLLALLFGPFLFIGWLLLILHGTLQRLRYVAAINDIGDLPKWRIMLSACALLALDSLVWFNGLMEALIPAVRSEWK